MSMFADALSCRPPEPMKILGDGYFETSVHENGRDIVVKPKWISVKQSLPKPYENVLVYQPGGVQGGNEIDVEFIQEDGFWSNQGIYSEISHWLPLPSPPEGI